MNFFAIGIGMIATSLLITSGFRNQGLIYNRFLIEPTEIISSYLNENYKNNLLQKKQYNDWSKENKIFLKNILKEDINKYSNNFINNVEKLLIIIKIDNILDAIGLSIYKQLIDIISNDAQNDMISIASGKSTIYLRQNIGNMELSEVIYIGLKEFQSKDSLLLKNLLRTFNNNERQVYDYVFFHEMGHFISAKMHKNGKLNEEYMLRKIEDMVLQDSIKNNIVYDRENIDILLKQYSESIGDIIAIELLYKKYPELKKNNDLPYVLSRVRTEEVIDLEHRTVGALVSIQEYFEYNDVPDNITDMLKIAHDNALINIEYYSKPLLKNKKEYISFSTKENKEKILLKIDTIREKISKEENNINYFNYKI